jgi:hypothetical protein
LIVLSILASTAVAQININSENNLTKIIGIDQTAFPSLKINVHIDKFCAMSGTLEKDDFKINENGNNTSIDGFYFTGNGSAHKLDLAIVFDDTGSMRDEIYAMKSKVEDMTNAIKNSGVDANYSLISFKDSVSIKSKWTNDPEALKKSVSALLKGGGNDEPEDSMDAIEAALSMGFRPDARSIILVITDAHAHYKNDGGAFSSSLKEQMGNDTRVFSNYTEEQVENDLKKSGAMLIVVSPKFEEQSRYVDLKSIADDLNSVWIDIDSADFSTILDQLKGIITAYYVIDYQSPDPNSIGNRTVFVKVKAPGCVDDTASSFYTIKPNQPPVIHRFKPDKLSPQGAGTAIIWTVNATDPDGDEILYKFLHNGLPICNWTADNIWTWVPSNVDIGLNRVEVQIRDGLHARPNESDDKKSVNFIISEPNRPPIINSLTLETARLKNPAWIANAVDPDDDTILYKFFLDDIPQTGWITDNIWHPVGNNISNKTMKIEVWVRDGLHAGMDGFDDRKSVIYNITAAPPTVPGPAVHIESWQKTFGGPDQDGSLSGNSVQQTGDGGYIIAGSTWSYGSGKEDAWLIKTDAKGNKLWDKTFGGPNDDAAHSARQTADGGYIIAVSTNSSGTGSYDIRLIKTDAKGNKLWEKTFGGPNDDVANSVQQTSDHGYIIAGYTWPHAAGKKDAWLIKTDAYGNKVWEKTFSDSKDYVANSAQQTKDGGYIIAGDSYPNSWLIKTNSYGNELWNTTLDRSHANYADCVRQTSDGGYVIGGSYFGTYSKVWLIRTDANGNKLWDRTFGGLEGSVGTSVQQTSDVGFIVAGSTYSQGAGGFDAWLIKTDENGNKLWDRTFGGLNDDEADCVQQTSDGGYIIAGSTYSYGSGGRDIWLIRTDANGNVG